MYGLLQDWEDGKGMKAKGIRVLQPFGWESNTLKLPSRDGKLGEMCPHDRILSGKAVQQSLSLHVLRTQRKLRCCRHVSI
jgi:hypothetical protein